MSEHFAKAVAYAVGDAIMCESLDEARQLAYHSAGSERYKVVTIDGSLINKAGLMTGGSSNGAILDDHTFRSCTLSAHLAPCMYSPSQHWTESVAPSRQPDYHPSMRILRIWACEVMHSTNYVCLSLW